jgi:L-aspartate oxidase
MAVTCQVFGRRAGEAATRFSKLAGDHPPVTDLGAEERMFRRSFQRSGVVPLRDLKRRLQECSDRSLLIARTETGLRRYLSDLEALDFALLNESRISDVLDAVQAMEIANLIETGRIMAKAALLRTESRGSHYREDHPTTSDEWSRRIIIDRNNSEGYFTIS